MNTVTEFIRKNFMGASITVTLVFGGTVTGEVVDGFDSFIGLKTGATTIYVNANFIVAFV